MTQQLTLSTRYRLDDESPWLEGIDPSRHYWIAINGDAGTTVAIPGLSASLLEEWKQAIRQFRSLQMGDKMDLVRIASRCTIYCISRNCYAIESEVNGALAWHLFDCETLYSLLMTAHPDWQCAPKDIELGRKMLANAWAQMSVA